MNARPFPWLSWIALGMGLFLTLLATLDVRSGEEAKRDRALRLIGHDLVHELYQQINAHALFLRAAAAFFAASSEVTRQEWQTFIVQSKTHQDLPAPQEAGFALLIQPDQLDAHQQAFRAEGFPEYRVWPAGRRTLYSAIVDQAPVSASGQGRFGYDLLTNPQCRVAMEQARDQDVVALASNVLLDGETKTDTPAANLMFVPVYRVGPPIADVAERQSALRGWIYSVYQMPDLMRGILGDRDRSAPLQVRFAVYEGVRIGPESLLYAYPTHVDDQSETSGRAIELPVDFNGQRWTLQVTPMADAPSATMAFPVLLVATSGSLISLLLAGLLRALSRSREYTEALESKITESRRVEQARDLALAKYRVLFESFPLGITVSDAQGRIRETNQAAERLLGLARDVQLSRTLDGADWQLLRRDGTPMPAEEFPSVRALREGGGPYSGELGVVQADTEVNWLTIIAAALPPPSGGVVVTCDDISERVAREQRHETVSAVAQLAASCDSLNGFHQALPPLLAARLGFPIAAIARLDPDHGNMTFLSSVGLAEVVRGWLAGPARHHAGSGRRLRH